MYKLKQELPKEFKIKVNPEQSEALQKHLFSIGKQWGSGDKYVKNTDDIFLYSYTYIFAANEKVYEFQKSQLPRIKFKDYFEKIDSFPEKITTEQFRAKYGKEQKVVIEASKIYKGILIDNAVELTKENDKLKHQILMLTEKLETIKKVIE